MWLKVSHNISKTKKNFWVAHLVFTKPLYKFWAWLLPQTEKNEFWRGFVFVKSGKKIVKKNINPIYYLCYLNLYIISNECFIQFFRPKTASYSEPEKKKSTWSVCLFVCLFVIKKVPPLFSLRKLSKTEQNVFVFLSNQIFFVKSLKATTRCVAIYSKKYQTSFRTTVRLKNVSLRILERFLKLCYVNVHWTSGIYILDIALF